MTDLMPTYPSWPHLDEKAIESVSKVLRSGKFNYWGGQEGTRFESEFSAFVGCSYGIAVANGTLALDLALHAVGVESGDEVIVTSRSFIASISCVVLRGAVPIFADVDLDSQNITVDTISACVSKKTRAIVVVHLAGWPCDMDPILDLALSEGIAVIEDCAQAHGAEYKGKPVGSLGNIGVFSFCQDKIMTTGGEGGMLTTNNREIWDRAWSFKDHGKDYETVFFKDHPPGYRWVHEHFGTNYRMTEMQATIGLSSLKHLPSWVKARKENAARLTEYFLNFEFLRVPEPGPKFAHSYYKYYVFVAPKKLPSGWTRDYIMQAINNTGVPCFNTYAGEVYLDKAFESAGLIPEERCKNAQELGATCLQFLVHPTLTEDDISDMLKRIETVFRQIAIGQPAGKALK